MPKSRWIPHVLLAAACVTAVSGCIGPRPALGPATAQPNTRPMRNFTSFSGALRCMDGMLAALPSKTYLISSSDIPDETKGLAVGADDMLINAINQLNRSSGRYVFLDQARISGFGQLEIVTTRKTGEQKPSLYIRGSISQVDTDVTDADAVATLAKSGSSGGLTGSVYRGFRKLSVVSVDLHLVQYPSRRVIPGASVANSMVVVRRGLSGTATGIIDNVTIGIPITIERVESQSQAVRNLVELGIIELLGRHSGVPYWQCLNSPATDARAEEKRERRHETSSALSISEVQTRLIALGYLSGKASGKDDSATRQAISKFQADQGLLPNGIVDFDLVERLNRVTATAAPVRLPAAPAPVRASPPPAAARPAPAAPAARPAAAPSAPPAEATSPECAGGENCAGIYKNLYDFVKEDVGF